MAIGSAQPGPQPAAWLGSALPIPFWPGLNWVDRPGAARPGPDKPRLEPGGAGPRGRVASRTGPGLPRLDPAAPRPARGPPARTPPGPARSELGRSESGLARPGGAEPCPAGRALLGFYPAAELNFEHRLDFDKWLSG